MVAIGVIAGVLCGTVIAVVWYRAGYRSGHLDGFSEGWDCGHGSAMREASKRLDAMTKALEQSRKANEPAKRLAELN
jgi:hypothetical protein